MLPQAEKIWTFAEAAHLFNRAGFGGAPDQIRALHAMGRIKAVDHLLAASDPPGAFPSPAWAGREQAEADAREQQAARRTLQTASAGKSEKEKEILRREFARKYRQARRSRGLGAQAWWFNRILATGTPLREKMTLFWHDHFATSMQKVDNPVFMLRQNELFRSHAFGSFRELTGRVIRDPAMMLYLDTQSSKKRKPNENFAREVMELFTLGEGHYTEQDIREAARAFTGYQLNRITGAVFRNRRQADDTEKTIFGKTGNFMADDVVALIFEKPQAARFITRKLWEYFVYENPSEKAVNVMADHFRRSGYQIAPLLRGIFLSKEFYSERAIRTQIKSPVQFIVSLLKQCEIAAPPVAFSLTAQQQLGQRLFVPPNVAGWDWGKAWINTNTLLTRYNIAGLVTTGNAGNFQIGGGKKSRMGGKKSRRGAALPGPDFEKIAPRPLRAEPQKLVDQLTLRFFQGSVPKKARDSFVAYATGKVGVVFTNTEVAELCHLMLSTPYYQLC